MSQNKAKRQCAVRHSRLTRAILSAASLLSALVPLCSCSRSSRSSSDAYWRGVYHEHMGRYEDALAEYKTAHSTSTYRNKLGEIDVARCLVALDRPGEAMDWLDDSIRRHPNEDLYLEKTMLIARSNIDEAIAYAGTLDLTKCRRSRFMALFYQRLDRPREAAEFAQRWVEESVAYQDGQSLEELYAVDSACMICLGAGLHNRAEHLARRGVELWSELLRRNGNSSDKECAAGSFQCRIVLARVAIRNGSLKDAEMELSLAKVLARTWQDQKDVKSVQVAIDERRK